MRWRETSIHALPPRGTGGRHRAYADSPLQNPINDANAIARELRQSGFTVELQTDASREAIQKAITAFCVQLAKQKAVGLFTLPGMASSWTGGTTWSPSMRDSFRLRMSHAVRST